MSTQKSNSIIKVSDGYICAGSSHNDTTGDYNGIVVKYDNSGNQQWFKSLSGNSSETFNSVISVTDGFICVGESSSSNLGFTYNDNEDAIVAKYNISGDQQWVKNFGGLYADEFNSIVSVDDGFICVGFSDSSNAGFTYRGNGDAIVVKYNTLGEKQWVKNDVESFNSIIKVTDGFICAGYTGSRNIGFTLKGQQDAIAIKYNNSGSIQWVKNFGGNYNANFNSIISINNGFIGVGSNNPYLIQLH